MLVIVELCSKSFWACNSNIFGTSVAYAVRESPFEKGLYATFFACYVLEIEVCFMQFFLVSFIGLHSIYSA
jgi:hypothetical protein